MSPIAITDFDDSSGAGAAPAHPAKRNNNTAKMRAGLHRLARLMAHLGGAVDAAAPAEEDVAAHCTLVEFAPRRGERPYGVCILGFLSCHVNVMSSRCRSHMICPVEIVRYMSA